MSGRPKELEDVEYDEFERENLDRLTPREPIHSYTPCEVHIQENNPDCANCPDCEIFETYNYPSMIHETYGQMRCQDEYAKLNPGWEPILYSMDSDDPHWTTTQIQGVFMEEYNALPVEQRWAFSDEDLAETDDED